MSAVRLAMAYVSAIMFALVSARAEGEQENRMAQTREGASKIVASRLGMSLGDYNNRNIYEKWCTGCKDWHARAAFGADRSRGDGLASSCLSSRKGHYDRTYVKTGRRSRAGVLLKPTRDGDKKQARARVNHAVDVGRLPNPNDLSCADCGHIGEGKRHEYDHHLGYSAGHQLSVEAVCSVCHHARERARRAAKATRAFSPAPHSAVITENQIERTDRSGT